MKTVLLTGISGYVGQHCAVELLRNGYYVKGSVRNLSKEQSVRDGITKEVEIKDNLEFCKLDLMNDEGWDEAMEGCDYVLHVASPFIIAEPKNEDVMIKPAVEGTLRALKSAKKAGIKKVILTSSTVSMAGDKKENHLTQDSWTNPDSNNISVYIKSKTLAEKAAWEFYKNQTKENKMELTVVNPGPIYGPTLTGNITGSSLDMFKKIMTGELSPQPKSNYVMSDVRDIAKIHVAAIENKESNGKRFLVTSETPYSFFEMASMIKDLGYDTAKPKEAPSWLLKIMSYFNSEVRGLLPFVDANITSDISTTRKTFNWKPIPFKKTIKDTALSISEVIK